ncbi:ArnT family glycosyltransferase [Nocardioides rubriscoriae]|uniref:ArnT family glycosyltransferase n=1 Tax=Nocardioides rubriscoriae TaxID=642762 RepID=UPI0011E01F6C|nr:glycosyltransferase family 39 protein [Nocardioides rubriscoriae]
MTTIAPDRPSLSAPPPEPAPPAAARPPRRVRPERAAYVVLLGSTAVLYLWGLGESGWANSFYAAAVQAGSESWKAFFFGASDAAGSITVDKPPLSLWPMALSVRVFGLSSWALLVPQALMGVASVAVLVALVRRATGNPWAGLLAGLTLAVTPVAALMFRFNNPDALLTLLMLCAAYATFRAVGSPRALRWLVLAGGLLGLAFLTKTLQAFLVLPGFAVTYAVFAALPWRTRVGHLLAAFGAMVAGAGWWVAIVELWPTGWWGSRPYIGGSQTNDFLELTFGYNGFGRLTGDETGSVGGGGRGWGSTGLLRLLGTDNGGQIAWLLPAALVLGVAAIRAGRRPVRVAASLMLGWLVVTAATFSFMAGIFHTYYNVALAPAIAACVALGSWALWQRRESLAASGVLGFTVALTSAWSFVLLSRTSDYHPWLRWTAVVLGFAAALMVVGGRHLPRRVAGAVSLVALVAALAGPTAYSLTTAATPHTGSIPTAGPSSTGGFGPGGGAGGLLNGSTSTATLTSMLLQDADSYDWVAATVGANSAAGYQLATEQSVMPIGGFNGSDPSPTLAQFQAYVADGRIHYFIAGGGGPGGPGGPGAAGGAGGSSEIEAWVAATYTAQTVDGVTVYDLTAPA